MRDGVDFLEVRLKLVDRLVRRVGHRLDDEAARADAGHLFACVADEDAEADARWRLLRDVEVLRQVIGDLTVRQRRAARDGVAQAGEARDGDRAVRADAAADIDLALGILRQVDVGIGDVAAHEALWRRIGRDSAERSVAVERDGQGLAVLEVGSEQQCARHRAAERGSSDGVAAVAADSLIDEVRGDSGVDAHAVRHRFDKMILHMGVDLLSIIWGWESEGELVEHVARIDVEDADLAVFEHGDRVASVRALGERRRARVEEDGRAALLEDSLVDVAADEEVGLEVLGHRVLLRIAHDGVAVRDDDAQALPDDVGVRRLDGQLDATRIDGRVAVALGDDDRDGAAVDARDETGRVVVGLHRVARAVVEHVARVHDEVSTLEEALTGMGPGHLVAVCIADDPDFHKDSPFLFSFVSWYAGTARPLARLPYGKLGQRSPYRFLFRAGGQPSFFSRLAISMADMAPSAPLLPAFVPARSMACSMFSVVTTEKIVGTPVCMPTWAMPFDASLQT